MEKDNQYGLPVNLIAHSRFIPDEDWIDINEWLLSMALSGENTTVVLRRHLIEKARKYKSAMNKKKLLIS